MALGEKLKQARLDQGLTASEVAAMTRMKVQMVEDLEREDFSKVAATIYGKGFIRLYAEQVGLDPAPLIDEYLTRFVDPAHGGKTAHKEPEPEEEEDFEDEESEGDLIARVVSFFKPSSDSEDEDEDLEPEPRTPYFPPKREEPVTDSEPESGSFEQQDIESKPESADKPVQKPVVRTEPEPDLFSMAQPELTEQPEAEPEEDEQLEIEPEVKAQISQPAEDEDEEDDAAPPVFMQVIDEKLELVKEVTVEVMKRIRQICSDIALDLKLQTRKLLMKLPDARSLDLSWNSIPVMITVLIIVILLISGLANIIRKASSGSEATEEVAVQEQVQEQELRIVVNPPEPYYK